MSKSLNFALGVVLTLAVPAVSAASDIVFDDLGTGQVAGWKPVQSATGNGDKGYWDRQSYDSKTNSNAAACAAGTLVAGVVCDWNSPNGVQDVTSPSQADPQGPPLEYFGLLDPLAPGADAPLNFYFVGPFDFDWAVLFQLTAWDSTVEFGWYEAGNPENRTAIFGPGGPYTNNDGLKGTTGNSSLPTGAFGFYYRNTRFATGDVLLFTESRFNQLGGYFAYFGEWGLEVLPSRFEDEATFAEAYDSAGIQQFALFRQGHHYWLGLEDQFGKVDGEFCSDVNEQPCADYDFNDFIIGWTEQQTVPEPATLTLLAGGLATVVWTRRRRRR
jgi:hypothetical protein